MEGSVSSTIFLACKAGKLGKAFQDVSPDMVAMITVLAIDALRYGYQLANGEITLANYSDLMAGDVFTALAAQAAGIALASLLPMIPFAFLAGSMAGGMLAAAGFDSGKKVVMEVMDTGGLGAVLPEQLVDGYNVGKDFVAHMSIDSAKSFFKNAVVSTNIDGKITAMLSGTGQ